MRGRYLCWISCLLLVWIALSGRGGPASPPAAEGQRIRLTGTVYRQEFKKTNQRLYLKNISFDSQAAQSLPQTEEWNKKRVIVYLKDPENVRIGSRLQVYGVCSYPQKARNPGGFDQEAYERGMGVGMLLYQARVSWQDSSVYPVRDWLFRFQLTCRNQLVRMGEEEDAGILSAMLLGDRGILDEDSRRLYQDAGIIHLLAVSGLHVSLTGMALYHLLRKMRLPYVFCGAFSGLVMAAYACMAGSVSAVRAVMMFWLYLLAQTTGRTYDLPTGLAAAAAAILLVRDTQLTQAGFLLSFGAVCGVLFASLWKSRLLGGTALGVSLGVQLFTLPLTASFYYQFPLYSLVINLCVVWMMPLVLSFAMAALAASAVSLAFGRFLLAPAHFCLSAAELLCEKARLLPFATVVTGKPAAWKIALYYLALAAVGLAAAGGRHWCGRGEKQRDRLPGAGRSGRVGSGDAALLLPLLLLLAFVLGGNRDGRFLMTFLDVGQGDGCCIQNERDSVWLVDGGSSSENHIGQYCLEPFLKSRGIQKVDYWLITHGDADHISGLLEILNSYERGMDGGNAAGISVGCILLSRAKVQEKGADGGRTGGGLSQIAERAAELGIEVRYVQKGTAIADGRMTVRILSPEEGAVYEDANASSVVAQAQYGRFTALLTGDVQGTAEDALLQSGLLSDVDVLKAAHHGSRNSTSEAFLEAVRPELTVISCGEDNSYGHPHEELLKRLADCGSNVCRTDRQGAVEICVTESGYRATAMLG